MFSIAQCRAKTFINDRGFTLIEMMVSVVILGLVLAVGMPSLSAWTNANKAASAAEFYMEGFRMARQQALGHNSASRILLTTNNDNGQMDWQVDICFPTSAVPCSDSSGTWSSPTSVAAGDHDGAAGYTSTFRSASNLPKLDVVAPTLLPMGTFSIYYTPLGWTDSSFATRLSRIQLDPGSAHAGQFPSTAIVVTLAGLPTRCEPGRALGDSRGCPP